jgi:hydroxyquinol 1,2-dioxygenase
MRNPGENAITQAVLGRHEHADDERLKTIFASLAQHLHVFPREGAGQNANGCSVQHP